MTAAWLVGAGLALGAVGCAGDETYVAGPRYPGAYEQREEVYDDARDVRQNTRSEARDIRSNARDAERDRRYHREDVKRDTRSNVRQYNRNR